MGILSMTISVAMFVKVEMVTEDMEWTAEHRCSPGLGLQLSEIGVHQNAMRPMCNKNVAAVNILAIKSVRRARRPCRENML